MRPGEVLCGSLADVGVKKGSDALNPSASLIYRCFEQIDENEPASTSDPLWRLAQIVEELGDLLLAISEALDDDPVIDEQDAGRIRNEREDLKRVAETFVTTAERGTET